MAKNKRLRHKRLLKDKVVTLEQEVRELKEKLGRIEDPLRWELNDRARECSRKLAQDFYGDTVDVEL